MITNISIIQGLSRKKKPKEKQISVESAFVYQTEQFADIRILRYKVPAFEELSLLQKRLVYYLSQAALCGRDILFDQNYRYNLTIRRTLETIWETYTGERNEPEFHAFTVYLKRIWFANGIHHHYSNEKFKPGFSVNYFKKLVYKSNMEMLPLRKRETPAMFIKRIRPLIFDESIAPKRICQDEGEDMIAGSAVNFYGKLSQKEVEDYYAQFFNPADSSPPSYGLNSKLIWKEDAIVEKVYKVKGMYSNALEVIVYWLEQAAIVAENDQQQKAVKLLVKYYETGDLKVWDEYNVEWVRDQESHVDFINGFIEVYTDPLGRKATWESVVSFTDTAASRRAATISANAQWFEDHAPIESRFRKNEVKGVSARVVTTAQLGGDCYPASPIGINLPNADWIRRDHGSKSVSMENISYSYHMASLGNGLLQEFCHSEQEIELAEKWGFLASNLHTDLHECVGHGSGQLLAGVSSEALRNYHSPLEEARADLFALYYMMDDKMLELQLMETHDVAIAAYNAYIRSGLLTQLARLEPGASLQQAHMRSRQLIAAWCLEKGKEEKVIERKQQNAKSYFVVNDHRRLRALFAELLAEIQRIKSEGDFEAGRELVESYGVNVDADLHAEVIERFAKLNLAPFAGFINPLFVPVIENGGITDVVVKYPDDYAEQMMMYAKRYSFLPNDN